MRTYLTVILCCALLDVSYSQTYIFTPLVGFENIKFDKSVKRKELNKYGHYTIGYGHLPMRQNRGLKHRIIDVTKGKGYIFDAAGLHISTSKYHRFKKYKTDRLILTIPLNAISDKGMILGESNKSDVINIYGEPDHKSDISYWYDNLKMEVIFSTDPTEHFVRNEKKINLFEKVIEVKLY